MFKDLTLLFRISFNLKRIEAISQANKRLQSLNQTLERLRTKSEIVFHVNVIGWESVLTGQKIIERVRRTALDFISAAADMEAYRMQFETLYGSAQKAQQVLNQIKTFAAKTPFEIAELTDAWRLMKAYGLEPNLRMMKAIGDAAASLGGKAGARETFQGLIVALGQIYAKGKLSAEELMQLAERGIPVYEILEEKLGLTREQLSNIGAAGIPAQAAIEAIIRGMEERFGGGMDRLSKTWQGTLSNLADLMYQFKAAVGKPIMDLVNRDLKSLLDAFNRLRETGELQKIIQGLSQGFVNFYRILRATAKAIWGVIGPIVRFLAERPKLMGAVMALGAAFAVLTITLGAALIAFGMIYGQLISLRIALTMGEIRMLEYAVATGTAAASQNVLATSTATMGGLLSLLTARLKAAAIWMGRFALSIARTGWAAFLRGLSLARAFFYSIGMAEIRLFRALKALNLEMIRTAVISAKMRVISGVRAGVVALTTAFRVLGATMVSSLRKGLALLKLLRFSTMKTAAVSAAQGIGAAMRTSIASIGSAFVALKGVAISSFTAIAGFIGSIVSAISLPVILGIGTVIAVVGLLYLAWKKNWFGIRDIVKRVMKSITDFFSKAFRSFMGIMGKFFGFLKKIFETLSKVPGFKWAEKVAKSLERVQKIHEKVASGEIKVGEVLKRAGAKAKAVGGSVWNKVKKMGEGLIFPGGGQVIPPIAAADESLRKFASGGGGLATASAPSPTINNYYLTQHFDRESVVITTGEIDAESFRELLGRIIKEEARG